MAPANNGQRLWKHVLPLILVVHVHAGKQTTHGKKSEPNSCRLDSIPGKEHIVLGMCVDPTKENYILPIMHVPHIFKPFHCAGVRLSSLPERVMKMS